MPICHLLLPLSTTIWGRSAERPSKTCGHSCRLRGLPTGPWCSRRAASTKPWKTPPSSATATMRRNCKMNIRSADGSMDRTDLSSLRTAPGIARVGCGLVGPWNLVSRRQELGISGLSRQGRRGAGPRRLRRNARHRPSSAESCLSRCGEPKTHCGRTIEDMGRPGATGRTHRSLTTGTGCRHAPQEGVTLSMMVRSARLRVWRSSLVRPARRRASNSRT